MTQTLTSRYGRLLFVGKGPAISAQLQAMARREGFHIEDQRQEETHEDDVATDPFQTSGLCRPSVRHRPPPSLAQILEGFRCQTLGVVPSDDPTFLPADKMFWANTRGGRLG